MHSDFKVRFFEKDDVNYLKQYYTSSTDKPFDEALWTWQYLDNYATQRAPIAFICLDGETDEFVGVIHNTPTIKRYREQDFFCTIGSDAYVRPEYRGKGVYNHIARTLLEHESMLGSMRLAFYNRITKTAQTSAKIIMNTSISLKILNPEKVSKIFFGDNLKGALAPYIYKAIPTKSPSQTDLTLREGNIMDYAEFYQQWSKNNDTVHTPRTLKYLDWRFNKKPYGHPVFYSIIRNERLVGYFAVVTDDRFESYRLSTLTISDYIITDNNPELFRDAVQEIIMQHPDINLVAARPFSTPMYQKTLTDIGFLDSMYFPLNQSIKPGSLGIRFYDKECRDFYEKTWYLTQADCF